jgi:hypothetical protein
MGHNHSFADMHRAVVKGVADASSELGDRRIGVGLIVIAVPAMGETEFDKTVDFVLDNLDTVVGFDTAGPETDPRMWARSFARVRDAGVPVTVHASECPEGGPPRYAPPARSHYQLHSFVSPASPPMNSCRPMRLHLRCVCVCGLSHWVHAAIVEVPDLPSLKCSSYWSIGLYPACVLVVGCSNFTMRHDSQSAT